MQAEQGRQKVGTAQGRACRAGSAAIWVMACSAASTAAVACSRPHARTTSATSACLPRRSYHMKYFFYFQICLMLVYFHLRCCQQRVPHGCALSNYKPCNR